MAVSRKFSGRAFISLNMMISLVVLILTSVVLYIMPAGRDARWTNWQFLSLAKEQWDALHTVGGLAFIIFGGIHLIVYNWKVFWNYIISKLRKNLNKKAEAAVAILLNVLIILVCVNGWIPSSTIMSWGATIKESWVKPTQRAPYGHAETERLDVLAKRVGLDLPAAVKDLEAKGLKVDVQKTVRALASDNGMTPAQFFELITPFAEKDSGAVSAQAGEKTAAETGGRSAPFKPGFQEGGGWGRKTVKMVAEESGIEINTALSKLKAKGIEAEAGDTLRELSSKAGLTPTEIATIIGN